MESSFGRSFDAVRVHTDAAGAELSTSVGAVAVTVGERVAFAPGAYHPETPSGEHLIAHEVAHVAQQAGASAAPMQAQRAHSLPSEPLELAAEQAANAVARGDRVNVAPVVPSGIAGAERSTRARLMRKARAGALPMLTVSTPVPGTGVIGPRRPLAKIQAANDEVSAAPETARAEQEETNAARVGATSGVAATATEAELPGTAPNEPSARELAPMPAPASPAAASKVNATPAGSSNVIDKDHPGDAKARNPAPSLLIDAAATTGKPAQAGASTANSAVARARIATAPEVKKGETASTVAEGANATAPKDEKVEAAGTLAEGANANAPEVKNVEAAGAVAEGASATAPKDEKVEAAGAVAEGGGVAPPENVEVAVPPAEGGAAGAVAAAVVAPTEEKAITAEAAAGADADAVPAEQAPREQQTAPKSPDQDPAFQSTIERLRAVAARQGHNNPAQQKASEALASASAPGNEATSQSEAAQVAKMNAEEPAPFDTSAFELALSSKIAQLTPQTFEEADKFKERGGASGVKAAVKTAVGQGKDVAGHGIDTATKAAPDPSDATPREAAPLPPTPAGAPPPDIAAEAATPKPKGASEVTFEKDAAALDQPLAEAGITDDQLHRSNEPTFIAAVESKEQAKEQATADQQAFRAGEGSVIAGAQVDAANSAQAGTAAMHETRANRFGDVVKEQAQAKGSDERKRADLASKIDGIYSTTKAQVENRLSQLDSEVDTTFDRGAEQAKSNFEDTVSRRIFAFKLSRYVDNPLLLLRDLLLPPPPEINAIYVEERANYIARMKGVVGDVAQVVATGLNAAKSVIAAGLAQVAAFVASLPEGERSIAQEAASNIQGRFDQLRQQVDQRRDQIIDRLAQKYVDNLKAIDDDLAKRREADKGLLQKAGDAIDSVIETIKQLKEQLLAVVAKAGDVIEQIIKDPIGFLSNLVSGVGQGLKNFAANIVTHLKKGFIEWLFGAVAQAGLNLPDKFDLAGIFSLVAQVLGLTYANIRKRAVGILGEPLVARLEQAAEIFKLLITKGPAGVWEYIKDKIGDLKVMVLDAIQNFVIEKLIIGGITFLLSMLNPASAFVKAVKMIIDIVMFIINRGSQIISLVNAILDSLAAIASGSVGAVASAVENALARFIPVAIGFLASLLGLGGIGDKIKSVIDAIQAPVNRAIDFLIQKAVTLVRKVGGFLTNASAKGGTNEPKPPEEADPQKQAKIDAGLAAIEQQQASIAGADQSVTREQAQGVAASVSAKHPVFRSIAVVDGGTTWDYEYVASPGKKAKGLAKEDKLTEMPLEKLTFNCKTEKYDITEYQSQLDGQAKGINDLKVSEWKQNRNNYSRPPEARQAQEAAREQYRQEQLALGKDKATVEKELARLAALHEPDLVAGGKFTIKRLGSRFINSSIGAQWPHQGRLTQLDNAVKRIPEKDQPQTRMNVMLTAVPT